MHKVLTYGGCNAYKSQGPRKVFSGEMSCGHEMNFNMPFHENKKMLSHKPVESFMQPLMQPFMTSFSDNRCMSHCQQQYNDCSSQKRYFNKDQLSKCSEQKSKCFKGCNE